MKIKLILGCLFLLLVYACSRTQSNEFEIKYEIEGIQSTTASVTIFGNKDAVTCEDIVIENGKFVFKGTTTEPAVARIWLNNDPQLKKAAHDGRGFFPVKSEQIWVIIYPGASMNVTGDITGKDYMSVNAKDKAENGFFAELAQKMMPLISQIGNIAVANSNPNITDDEKEANREKSKQLNAELEQVKLDFINSRVNSIAAFWLMEDMLIRSEIKPEDLAPFLAKADKKKYADNYFYKAVSYRVEGALATSVGQICPDIETTDSYDGQPFSLSDMKGKYVLIDFWGTWCSPCMKGMPHMKAFRDKHRDKLQILGVSNDKDLEIWKSAIEQNNMDWPNIIIGKGDKDFVAKFNVQGFPTKILLNPEGKILLRESGEKEEFYHTIEIIITNTNT